MRILPAAIAVAVLATTAHAQDFSGKKGRGSPQNADQQNTDPRKKKAAEEAFQAGIKQIPEPKQKYDPWRTAR
jgi:hypothetical protein